MGNTGVPEEACYTVWGLRISMYFQNAIGNHMNGSGLVETASVDSGLLGKNASEYVVNGKAYKRAMRAHRFLCSQCGRC